MSADTERLGHTNVAFGIAVAVTALFNTALACGKDAYRPLQNLMDAIAGQNWTTQGLADVILFVGLGLLLSNTRVVETLKANRVISFLVAAVLVAGVGLLVWYVAF